MPVLFYCAARACRLLSLAPAHGPRYRIPNTLRRLLHFIWLNEHAMKCILRLKYKKAFMSRVDGVAKKRRAIFFRLLPP